MNLTFTLANSPYFLGALLVLLLLILILRNPTKSFFKFLIKKIKAYYKKIKSKKEKSNFVSKEIVKVVKIEPTKKKIVSVYYSKVLFLILGMGVILSTYVKNWVFLTSKYEMFYNFIFSATSHNNLTTIIVTLVIGVVLLWLLMLIDLLQGRKKVVYKIIYYVLFSFVVAASLVTVINSVNNLSLINSTIMGIVFVLLGISIKRKK